MDEYGRINSSISLILPDDLFYVQISAYYTESWRVVGHLSGQTFWGELRMIIDKDFNIILVIIEIFGSSIPI